MRQIKDFSDEWTINATAPGDIPYAPAVISLPFIHDGESISGITLEKTAAVPFPAEKNLWLEIYGVTGLTEVYLDGERLDSHESMQTMFRVKLSDSLSDGDEFDIRLEITPRPRSDGRIIIGGAKLVESGPFGFAKNSDGAPGVIARGAVDGGTAALEIIPDTENTTNYDIITASYSDSAGNTVAVKSAKGTAKSITLPIPGEYIYSPSNTGTGRIDISAVRDTAVLDNLALSAAVFRDDIFDGIFRRNGRETALKGITLADFSSVSKDLDLACDEGFNAVMTDGLTAKNNLFSMLDSRGLTGFYRLPYTGEEKDFSILRETVLQNCAHPSFRFVCCDPAADEAYARRFTSVVNGLDAGVIPVLARTPGGDMTVPENGCPPVVMADIPCTRNTNAAGIANGFSALSDSCPAGTVFVLNIIPFTEDEDEDAEIEICRVQREIISAVYGRKGIIGLFCGSIRAGGNGGGLYAGGRETLACGMYRAIAGKKEYLGIEGGDSVHVSGRDFSMTVFSDNSAFKLLVNGKAPKNFTVEKLAAAIYRIGGISLSSRVTLVEISAGEQCDNITVYRDRGAK